MNLANARRIELTHYEDKTSDNNREKTRESECFLCKLKQLRIRKAFLVVRFKSAKKYFIHFYISVIFELTFYHIFYVFSRVPTIKRKGQSTGHLKYLSLRFVTLVDSLSCSVSCG